MANPLSPVTLVLEIMARCSPAAAVDQHRIEPPSGRTIIIAAGKAAGPMADAFVSGHSQKCDGIVVIPSGFPRPICGLRCIEAGHPWPTLLSVEAADAALLLASEARAGDLVVALISGGASALLCAPPQLMSLNDKLAVTEQLLRSGRDIADVNLIRRHLSTIKGGRLAATAWPARTLTLAVSDVVGDEPWVIGSGPTVGDPTTIGEARALAREIGLPNDLPWSESINPQDPRLCASTIRIVLSPADLMIAAEKHLSDLGYLVCKIGDALIGDAAQAGTDHAMLARAAHKRGKRVALLSGGELTVTVRGNGQGGPNQEYVLSLARGIVGLDGVTAIAADTDGRDGVSGAAGGVVDSSALEKLAAVGIDVDDCLSRNDSGSALQKIDGLLMLPPTGNNLNDLRMILVEGR